MDMFHSLFATPHSPERIALAACFVSLCFAGLVVLARSMNPIPSRTRPLNSSAPMVLWLKPWESRSLPGLPSTRNSSLRVTNTKRRLPPEAAFLFVYCDARLRWQRQPMETRMRLPRPQPPKDAPEGTVWFGGPIGWFSISLILRADDLVPQDITRLLLVEPTRTRSKGRPLSERVGAAISTFSSWQVKLTSQETDEWDVSEAIWLLIDRFPKASGVWKQLLQAPTFA